MASYRTQEIADRIRGQLRGSGDVMIHGMASLDRAGPGQLAFVREERHLRGLSNSKAAAALVSANLCVPETETRPLISAPDVDLAVAMVLEWFAPPPPTAVPGVHPTAVIDPTASLGQGVSIGPHVWVGPRVRIGDHTILYANVSVMDDASIGSHGRIYPGTVIGARCEVGDRCILHMNVSIGADGFNYRPAPNGAGLMKIPQIGSVRIGHDVEIGAGTCIDRGKFDATEIGQGTKIDNLVQIGHNCRIGRCVVIAGATAMAGSVEVGDGAMIGGHASIRDHVTIGKGAKLAAGAAIMNHVPAGQTYMGYPAQPLHIALRELAAVRKLPKLIARMRNPSSDESSDT